MNNAAPTSSTSANPISLMTRKARLVLPKTTAGSTAALLDCRVQIDTRRLECGNQAEDEARHERDDRREREHSPVDADASSVDTDARNASRVDRQQRTDADHADHEPEHATHRREHDALRQQLADDSATARTDGGTNRELPLADGRANQQQVRDVRARDQQNEAHSGQQHPQRRSDVSDDDLLHRLDAEPTLATECVGKGPAEFVRGLLQLSVGRRERDPGFQSPGGLEKVALHHAVRIDLEGQPDVLHHAVRINLEGQLDVGRACRRLDGFRIERAQDADHFVWLAVE